MIGRGSGHFIHQDPAHKTGKALAVWYHRPKGFGPRTPVVILLHGSDRAARYFRDCWIDYAERHRFLVIAPEFDERAFPGAGYYNYGNVLEAPDANGRVTSRDLWTDPIIDRIFERVRSMAGMRCEVFSLFGHSAGGQFAHRYLTLTEAPSVGLCVAANCGWYMMPEPGLDFPAGIGGLELGDEAVERFLARPLVLLLGESDIAQDEAGLPQFPGAIVQGPHRLARGRYYYSNCRETAARIGADFNWRLVTAPGVGHDDKDIAGPAAEIIAASLKVS